MKRTKSLIASILGTVVTGVQVIVSLYIIFAYVVLLGQVSGEIDDETLALVTMAIVLMVVLLLFLITTLILTCLTFKPINGSPEKYAKGKGIIITTIVFNFLLAILFFISCDGSNAGSVVFSVICALILIAANVLYIIDLAQEKSKVEKLNQEQAQTAEASAPEATTEQVVADENKTETKEEK